MHLNMRKTTHSMLEGAPLRHVLIFCSPLIVGNIFQQLYNTVNAAILGNHVGSEALAAIGVFNPINNLLIGLFTGISTGATVVVSQSFGAGDRQRLNQSILISLFLTLIGGVVTTFIGILISRTLLGWIGTPDNIIGMAALYTRIMFMGLLPMFLFNILSGILRGIGDSFFPVVYLIISNLVNIGLLFLFVFGWGMGIDGAAWATVSAQTVAAILTLIHLIRKQRQYDINLKGQRLNWTLGKRIFAIGFPAGMQTSIFSIGFLLQQNLINSFGSTVIAAYSAVTRMDQFVMLPMNSFAIAITTFVGQNIGARKLTRAQQGIRETLWMSQCVTLVLAALIFMFGDNLMFLFTKDADVMRVGSEILRILSIGYVLVNTYVVLSGAVRGMGDSVAPLMASFTCNVVIRVSLAYTLVSIKRDYRMVFLSIAIAWTLCSVFVATYYRLGFWRRFLRFKTEEGVW